MLSFGMFDIAGREVWIAVLWDEKILGITFSLDRKLFEDNISRLADFLVRRGVKLNLSRETSPYPETIKDVILGKVENHELLPKLAFEGVTPFERKVYEWLTKNVKRGSVITYGSLARALNTSPRAVGGAMKRNPYPVVVPCHRVVAKDGIGHYTPRLKEKMFLLEIEGVKEWTSSRLT